MEKNYLESYYNEIVRSLRFVAAPFDVQKEMVPGYVCLPDDVALDFHNAFLLCDQLLEEGRITEEIYHLIETLDSIFTEMTDLRDDSLWTEEGMQTSEYWIRSRKMATKILSKMDLGHIKGSVSE